MFFSLYPYVCVCIFFPPGNSGASDHAPGGGTVGGGPHLHRRLPADLQDLPVKPHGGRQETAGVVPGGQPPGHGEFVLVRLAAFGRSQVCVDQPYLYACLHFYKWGNGE